MNTTGRLPCWLLSALLVGGGCGTSALLHNPSPSPGDADLATVTAQREPTGNETFRASSTTGKSAATVAGSTDETLIRNLALEKGHSEEEISQLLNAVHTADPRFRPILVQSVLALMATKTPPGRDEPSPSVLTPESQVAEPGLLGGGESPDRERVFNSSATSSSQQTTSASGSSRRPAKRAGVKRARPAGSKTASNPLASIDRRSRPADQNDKTRSDEEPPASSSPETTDSEAPDSKVVAVSLQAEKPTNSGAVSWPKQLRQVIAALRTDLEDDTLEDEQRRQLQAFLGLLYLAAEDREKAMQSLEGFHDEQELEFWRQTVMGLGILLEDPDELPKFKHRVESATEHFRAGNLALSTLGPLRVKNLAFCTKVNGFGDMKEFDSHAFRPGQQVLLYTEIENYTVEQVESVSKSFSSRRGLQGLSSVSMYETELHGHYEILDATQRTVASRTLPIDRNRCRNHRRDYFIPYLFNVPDKIAPGAYTLELTIEDKKGGKFGNAVIDFRVR